MPRAAQSKGKTVPAPASDQVPARLPLPNLFVGTSGWAYPTWKPDFYPAGLAQKNFLAFYSSRLTTVEVNYTFRALPTPKMLEGWLAATPPHFRFAFKAPQRITHFSRLRDAAAHVDQFLAALEPVSAAGRLGPLLFQLPPNFKSDPGLLKDFLSLPALSGPAAPRLAFEFRHASWLADPIYDVLGTHNAALCIAHAGDEPGDLATPEVHTASTHTTFRLRRSGGYSPAELAAFAARYRDLARDREVYVALRHEDEPTGALNASTLLDLAGALPQ